MGKFIIKKTATGFNFHLKAVNGETIATSEVYTTLHSCQKGIAAVQKCAVLAGIEDQTNANCKSLKNPKFELYADKAGLFRFRLKASNGKIIAISESYTTKANCLHGVKSVKNNVVLAQVIR